MLDGFPVIAHIRGAASNQAHAIKGKTRMNLGNIMTQSITFWPSEVKASEIAEANGGAAEGFTVAPAKGRPGKFVIEVRDTDDNYFLGYL